MRKLIFAIFLFLASLHGYSQVGIGMGFHIPLNGNSSGQQGHNTENEVQRMKSDLALNDDQVIKVRSLLVERQRRHNGSDPMTPREFNQRLETILTPQQLNKLAEIKQQKQQHKSQTPPNNGTNTPKPAPNNQDADDVYN